MTSNKRIFILPYKRGSKSVAALYREFEEDNIKAIRVEGSKYKPRENDFVINWGNSTTDIDFPRGVILNHPNDVKFVSNKLNFFRMASSTDLSEEAKPRIPLWTQNTKEVEGWLSDGHIVFARTKLSGHSGEGIVVLDPKESPDVNAFQPNTLFTRYQKKKEEYRVHFFKGKLIDIQRKAKRTDVPDANFMIRSHNNGFIYSRNNVGDIPSDVTTQAEKTVALGTLDFGAIDIIYNKMHNLAYVLEVNSAPGLEGTTLANYVTAIRKEFGAR